MDDLGARPVLWMGPGMGPGWKCTVEVYLDAQLHSMVFLAHRGMGPKPGPWEVL